MHKPKGLMFKAPMVRALLAGTKTLTRRIVKPQPVGKRNAWCDSLDPGDRFIDLAGDLFIVEESNGRHKAAAGVLTPRRIKCPYGDVGDNIYVKETWAVHESYNGRKPRDLPREITIECRTDPDALSVLPGKQHRSIRSGERGRWRSAMFMPRWASRITLELTDVRIERLQEIETNDCYEEGLARPSGPHLGSEVTERDNARCEYRNLWDSINAKAGHGWIKNPWVWCLSFRRII